MSDVISYKLSIKICFFDFKNVNVYMFVSKVVKGFMKCFNFRIVFIDYYIRFSSVDCNVNVVCCVFDFYFRNRSVRKVFVNEFMNF